MRLRSFRPSLRVQIAALGIGGVLALGLISAFGSHAQGHFQAIVDQSRELRTRLAEFRHHLLAAHQIETEFLLQSREALIAQRQDQIARAEENLAAVEERVATRAADDPLRRAETIRVGLNLYAVRFQNVVAARRTLGFTEKEGLQGNLRAAVHAVEERLSRFDQPSLTVPMLMMRRHEKDFILRGEDRYSDALRERVTEFETALAAAPLADTIKAELKALVGTYESRFLAYAAGASTLREESDDLTSIYGRIEPILAQVVEMSQAEDAQARAESAVASDWYARLTWCLLALSILCAGALSWWVGQRLSGPLTTMARAMERLADGDLTVHVAHARRRDEIGAIARAFATFRDKMAENGELTQAQASGRARSEAERKDALRAMADRFETAVGGIIGIVASAAVALQTTAEGMSGMAVDTARRSATAAAAAEEATANVNAVAAAAEELDVSVQDIGRQVDGSATLARAAANDAGHTVALMQDLNGVVARIGDVTHLISDIAGRTNLLALNATIEAARAGESGRGFAVVAAEVKDLANQTTQATAEIADQIARIQASTGQATAAIGTVVARIEEISEVSDAVAASVEAQGAATQEIAHNVAQAAAGTGEVTGTVAGVASAAEATGVAASQVLASASDLSRQSANLSAEVDRFLNLLRAA
ncbi:methyl-accepting chemotaxis protein [Methylobacterium sp. J-068]|uniref:methyl-accepting chemotaxis protein n=1 Tax=Methylobacterium sp. J-068 TaxID=2836649 RepID=UPI001FBAB9EC|nr:HAMP domain-containing methyl-accepting chemotaxis protein [Methylobacterium sp. J-068]MCJ2036591.1 methyl-accepting chemotaxis protein [Methylobacterium sp. J-068]